MHNDLYRENEQLTRDNSRYLETIDGLRAELDKLRTDHEVDLREIERLRGLLSKYGRHDGLCLRIDGTCNCGWDAEKVSLAKPR